MKNRYTGRSKTLMFVLVVLLMAAVAGGELQASNMGFKMNKVIYKDTDGPGNGGMNLVTIPRRNPSKNLKDVCDYWGLTGIVGSIVEQVEASSGTPNTFNCFTDNPGAAKCLLGCTGLGGADCNCSGGSGGVGLLVTYTSGGANLSGIIVGSHVSGPPGINIFLDAPGPGNVGLNRYPHPYHGTAVTANDICVQAGLNSTLPITGANATLERIDAQFGTPVGFICGDNPGAAFTLVLGEAVNLLNNATILGYQPPHF